MKFQTCFIMCFTCVSVSLAAGQAKTVTNTDLEKYRSARVKAETDLRENYARLGFPSPEELRKRNEQSAKETSELAARLRADRLDRERIEAERDAAQLRAPLVYGVQPIVEIEREIYGGSYFLPGGRRFRIPFRRPFQQPGYFAGGMFIPTGPATRPRPIWRSPRP